MHKTLVVIPAYDEADSLPSVLKELREQVPASDVLVVSDGSTDATASIARSAGARVVELPINLGVGGALRVAFRDAVRDGRYERLVQIDADGQHEPLVTGQLLDRIDAGADLVIGSRFAAGGAVTYDVSAFRRCGMRILGWLVRALTGQQFTDTTSGFRAFSRPMVDFFARSYPSEYMGDTVEALVNACNAGFRVEEVAVNMRGRDAGAPSTRGFRLFYYYVRLVVVLIASAGRRPRTTR